MAKGVVKRCLGNTGSRLEVVVGVLEQDGVRERLERQGVEGGRALESGTGCGDLLGQGCCAELRRVCIARL